MCVWVGVCVLGYLFGVRPHSSGKRTLGLKQMERAQILRDSCVYENMLRPNAGRHLQPIEIGQERWGLRKDPGVWICSTWTSSKLQGEDGLLQ